MLDRIKAQSDSKTIYILIPLARGGDLFAELSDINLVIDDNDGTFLYHYHRENPYRIVWNAAEFARRINEAVREAKVVRDE